MSQKLWYHYIYDSDEYVIKLHNFEIENKRQKNGDDKKLPGYAS